jgi:hypothetical protein
MEVSRSANYGCSKCRSSRRQLADAELMATIQAVFDASKGVDDVQRTLVPGATVLLHDSDGTSTAGSWKATLAALPLLAEHWGNLSSTAWATARGQLPGRRPFGLA